MCDHGLAPETTGGSVCPLGGRPVLGTLMSFTFSGSEFPMQKTKLQIMKHTLTIRSETAQYLKLLK